MKNKSDNSSLIHGNFKIGWSPCYHVERIGNEGIFLFAEKGNVFLEGEIYLHLNELLKERRYSADELASLLEKEVGSETVFYALYRLEKKFLIQACLNEIPSNIAGFCASFEIPLHVAIDRLKTNPVFVKFLEEENDEEFLSALRSLHLILSPSLANASFSIVVAKDYLQPELFAFNQQALKKNHPWMLVKPYGSKIWIGPIFEPNKTGCWDCLATRLKRNRAEEGYIEKRKGIKIFLPESPATLQCSKNFGYNFAALEIFKRIFLGENKKIEGKIITFDTHSLKLDDHFLMKQPRCSCSLTQDAFKPDLPPMNGSDSNSFPLEARKNEGAILENITPSFSEPEVRASREKITSNMTAFNEKKEEPIILTSRKKIGGNEGGFRCVTPEETIKKYSPLISPITGIVQYVERSPTNYGSSIHVYQGGVNHALPQKKRKYKIESFRSSSSGKGISEIDAKAGCLCEAIERYSCLYQGNEPYIKKSYTEIKEQAIDPRTVLLFSEEQYRLRERTNLLSSGFNYVSAPFSETIQHKWSPVWSLTEQCYKYYPTRCCYFEYDSEEEGWNAHADSNGCAAGNSLEEAILQGFFELVERDSVAIWWYNRLQRPCLDLTSFGHPYIEKHLHEYQEIGRECWALDLTTDLKIPTVVALSRLKTGKQEKILMGFGAHLDFDIALIRALTEMNQFLSVTPFWEDQETKPSNEKKDVEDWMNHATLQNQPYLQGKGKRVANDFLKWKSRDLLEDIHYCQSLVESLGMEFLILDHTQPDIGLPVARVIVPGLRHFWRRLGPGRLYDIPVKMGWLTQPTLESNMNPISMFL